MSVRSLIFVSVIFLFLSCSSEKTQTTFERETMAENIMEKDNVESVDSLTKESEIVEQESVSPLGILYKIENDTLLQILTLIKVDEEEVNFRYVNIYKIKNDSISIKGVARFTGNGSEIDCCNNLGSGFPMREYVLDGDCKTYLMLHAIDKSLARVNIVACKNKGIISSVDLLKVLN